MTQANVLAQLGAQSGPTFRNRIINGAMVINQRAFSGTPDNQYTLDRWTARNSQTGKYTLSQNAGSVTPPIGFVNYLGVTSSSAYSVGAAESFWIRQIIEGYNIADLGWGTANAKTVTLSFWAYSSLTGTFGGTFVNNNTDRQYIFSYSIPAANTWTQISVTIAGCTDGTWESTTSAGINVNFSLGTGSTWSGTAGSWITGGSFKFAPTGSVSVVGTSGATWYVTGVQLEVGSSATGFEYVNYQTSLANCQRYYQLAYATIRLLVTTGYSYWTQANMVVSMRATPTVTATNTYEYRANLGSFTASASGVNAVELQTTATGTGDGYTTQNLITCSAEL